MCSRSRMIIALMAAVLAACGETTSTTSTTTTGLPMGAVEVEQSLEVDDGGNRAPEIQGITFRPQHPRPGEKIVAQVEKATGGVLRG